MAPPRHEDERSSSNLRVTMNGYDSLLSNGGVVRENEADSTPPPTKTEIRFHENGMNLFSSGDDDPPSNEYVLNVAFFSFIGFVVVQTVFALIGHSQSMLADSQAMAVDAMTYLLNLLAERYKPPSNNTDKGNGIKEKMLLHYRNELVRLHLELVPPLLSVVTLIAVTFMTLQEAIKTLTGDIDGSDDDDVSVPIMLLFSAANLLLDVVNVTCFARADAAFLDLGLITDKNNRSLKERGMLSEEAALLQIPVGSAEHKSHIESRLEVDERPVANLNMCSAWTHVCADTMRSIAVLVAAAVAFAIPSIDGALADSVAAVVVSMIILASLFPLLQGLYWTLRRIIALKRTRRNQIQSDEAELNAMITV